MNSTTSCWGAGNGSISDDGHTLMNIVCDSAPSCKRTATGTIKAQPLMEVVDHDYTYANGVL